MVFNKLGFSLKSPL